MDSFRLHDNDNNNNNHGNGDDYDNNEIYDADTDADISSVLDSIGKYLEVGFKKSKVGHDINNKSTPATPPPSTLTLQADHNFALAYPSMQAKVQPVASSDSTVQPQQTYVPPAATAGVPLQLKELRIKFEYQEEKRILAMDRPVIFDDLWFKIRRLYGQPLLAYYHNPHKIQIKDQMSLDDAISLLEGNQSLRLFLSQDTITGDYQSSVSPLTLLQSGPSTTKSTSKPISSGFINAPDEIPAIIGDGEMRLVKGRKLGSGAFGTVYACFDQDTGRQLAVKVIPIATDGAGAGDKGGDSVTQEVTSLRRELQLLRSMKHERIVMYMGSQETPRFLFIFMEYVVGGSLRDQLNNYGALTERNSRKWTAQVLEGLDYLHTLCIVHRDVKGANILLTTSGDVKLSDFGASKQLESIRSTMTSGGLNTFVGTAYWIAPEVINNQGYGRKADIWSLGCTLVEMLTTKPPFAEYESIAAIFRIANAQTGPSYKLPECCSASASSFLDACFTRNPTLRPNAQKLLNHEFVLAEV